MEVFADNLSQVIRKFPNNAVIELILPVKDFDALEMEFRVRFSLYSDNKPNYREMVYNSISGIQFRIKKETEKVISNRDTATVVEYMLKHPISEELRLELGRDFKKGVFILTEYMNRIIKS